MILIGTTSEDVEEFKEFMSEYTEGIRNGWNSYWEMFHSTGEERTWARLILVIIIMMISFIVCLVIFTDHKRFNWEHPTRKKAREAEAMGHAVDAILVEDKSYEITRDIYSDDDDRRLLRTESSWKFDGRYKYSVDGKEYKYRYTIKQPPKILRLYWLKNPKKPFCIDEDHISPNMARLIMGIPIIVGLIAAKLLGVF